MKTFNRVRVSKKPISKNIMTILALYSVAFVFSGSADSANQFELFYSDIGVSGESSSENFSQRGSVLQTDGTEANSEQFSISENTIISSDCFVEFEAFALFAEHWLETNCGADGTWCGGADIDRSDDVGLDDLNWILYYWLTLCPDNWPWLAI